MKTAPLKNANRPRIYSDSLGRERLVKLRNKVPNLTQWDLSKELGVNRSTIPKLETGERKLSTHILHQLAQYYNTSADYILGLTEVSHTDDPLPACDKLGLSDRATIILEKLRERGLSSQILSKMIEHECFDAFLAQIENAIFRFDDAYKGKLYDSNINMLDLASSANAAGFTLIPAGEQMSYHIYKASELMRTIIYDIAREG